MRPILVMAVGYLARRALQGRGRQLLHRAIGAADSARSGRPASSRHVSAAAGPPSSGYSDDRDVRVGEQFAAVGMRPGAR